MILNKIINQVNKLVSNNSSFKLSYDKLEFYLNKSVDNINRFLRTKFRTPEEYFEDSKFYYSVLKYINNNDNIIYLSEALSIKKEDIKKHFSKCIYFYDPSEKVIYTYDKETGETFNHATQFNDEYTYFFYVMNLGIFVKYSYTDGFEEITEANAYSEYNITIYNNVNDLIDIYDYNEFPDRYIRSCLVYYTAALYLEEEDEVESQYSMYLSKADDELTSWRKEYFSCYNTKW